MRESHRNRVAYLSVLGHFAFEVALARVAGAANAARGSLAGELIPVREHLEACPFAHGQHARLREVDVVI